MKSTTNRILWKKFCGRFDNWSQSKFGVVRINSSKSASHSTGTSSSSQSIMEPQKTRGRVPALAASRFHFKGCFQLAGDVRRRVAKSWPKRSVMALA